jgi:hypothetical protein
MTHVDTVGGMLSDSRLNVEIFAAGYANEIEHDGSSVAMNLPVATPVFN